MQKTEENSIVVTALGAFVLHFVVAQLNPTLLWPDEIFQTIEQGHRMVFGYGVVPWEFRDGVRSWVLPGLLGLVMRLTAPLGPGSQGYLLGLRLFLALCALTPVMVAMLWARRLKLPHPYVAGIATAVWFELVFFSSKALTEVFAAYALTAALYFSVASREEEQPSRAGLWAGLAWGFAVGFRMHLAPAAAVGLVWACRKDLSRWRQHLPGFVGVLLFFGLVDWATWSYPFQSFVSNFWVNVMKGKAATFGVSPPWEYLRTLGVVWSWAAVPVLALAAFSFRRWPVLGWTALVIFLAHTAISHKEYRFLVPFVAVVIVAASLELNRRLAEKRDVGLALCAVWLVASADGARRYDYTTVPPYPPKGAAPVSMWKVRHAEVKAFRLLSVTDDVCGVAGGGLGWGGMGGYATLHKDVPMFDLRNKPEVEQYRASYNYVVSLVDNAGAFGPEFSQVQCWGETCLFRREGGCETPGDYTINKWLAATGM